MPSQQLDSWWEVACGTPSVPATVVGLVAASAAVADGRPPLRCEMSVAPWIWRANRCAHRCPAGTGAPEKHTFPQHESSQQQTRAAGPVYPSHHGGATTQCTTHTLPAQTPQPVMQSRHSPPTASRERTPSEPMHGEQCKLEARQRTAWHGTDHSAVTAACARHEERKCTALEQSISSLASGMPFDRS